MQMELFYLGESYKYISPCLQNLRKHFNLVFGTLRIQGGKFTSTNRKRDGQKRLEFILKFFFHYFWFLEGEKRWPWKIFLFSRKSPPSHFMHIESHINMLQWSEDNKIILKANGSQAQRLYNLIINTNIFITFSPQPQIHPRSFNHKPTLL